MGFAIFIKISIGFIVLLYVFAVNKYRPAQTKKSLKSPIKNDFTAFGDAKAQLTTKEVLKLLGYENPNTKPTITDSNLPTDTETDPKFEK
jgi:hypothetical protein